MFRLPNAKRLLAPYPFSFDKLRSASFNKLYSQPVPMNFQAKHLIFIVSHLTLVYDMQLNYELNPVLLFSSLGSVLIFCLSSSPEIFHLSFLHLVLFTEYHEIAAAI